MFSKPQIHGEAYKYTIVGLVRSRYGNALSTNHHRYSDSNWVVLKSVCEICDNVTAKAVQEWKVFLKTLRCISLYKKTPQKTTQKRCVKPWIRWEQQLGDKKEKKRRLKTLILWRRCFPFSILEASERIWTRENKYIHIYWFVG